MMRGPLEGVVVGRRGLIVRIAEEQNKQEKREEKRKRGRREEGRRRGGEEGGGKATYAKIGSSWSPSRVALK